MKRLPDLDPVSREVLERVAHIIGPQSAAAQALAELNRRIKAGQHVGMRPVVVTVTHIPTGISASICQRSQHMARTIAIDMILAALTHPRFT